MDKAMLGQVFQAIPSAIRAWPMRSGSTLLEQAASYLENYLTAKKVVMWPGNTPSDRRFIKARDKGSPDKIPKNQRAGKSSSRLQDSRGVDFTPRPDAPSHSTSQG